MNTVPKAKTGESRSHRAVLSWQLAGIVNGLRLTAPCNLPPGKGTIALLARVREQMEAKGEKGLGLSGVAIDNIPHLDDQASPVEVLIIAEALNSLIQCVLEPDEREEQERFMGFRPLGTDGNKAKS
ncbi:MAG: hypothetical protein NTX87_04755 [Planctomycetota bacterium]|nr:hypothetical protein [Planctomycetota bacterium]